jgi:hypothetical protein
LDDEGLQSLVGVCTHSVRFSSSGRLVDEIQEPLDVPPPRVLIAVDVKRTKRLELGPALIVCDCVGSL